MFCYRFVFSSVILYSYLLGRLQQTQYWPSFLPSLVCIRNQKVNYCSIVEQEESSNIDQLIMQLTYAGWKSSSLQKPLEMFQNGLATY